MIDVMSVFRTLLLLLLFMQQIIAEFAAIGRKISNWIAP